MEVTVSGERINRSLVQTGLQEDISFPLVFIDGITRCGKSSLSGIVPSLTNMEHIQFSTILELIIPGMALGKLDPDYAQSFVRIYLNELSYNLTLGRNVNFRKSDQTGIQNYKDPKMYYSRLEKAEGIDAISNCRSSENSIPFQTHDFLVNFDKLIELELKFKMLSLWRDPIDNIYSWWTRGWGERFMNGDPSAFKLIVKISEVENFPWYCEGSDFNVSDLNPMERCVVMATDLIQRAVDSYFVCKSKEKILPLFFEDLCREPDAVIKSICNFLDVETTVYTSEMVSKARFPRDITPTEKVKKMAQFERNVRPDLFERLMDYNDKYQANRYGLV